MRIKFLSDYLGRETAMKEYKVGDVDDFGVAQALELIRLGVGEEVPEIETTSIMDNVRTFEYVEAKTPKPRRKVKK